MTKAGKMDTINIVSRHPDFSFGLTARCYTSIPVAQFLRYSPPDEHK